MSIEDVQLNNFLQQLYQKSGGDVTAEVSMYEIGATLGLDKSEAGGVAEDLIIDGYAELKNLTGGISITTQGLRLLDVDISDGTDGSSEGIFVLGEAEVLSPEICQAVELLTSEIKRVAAEGGFSYSQVEELVIEVKTLETQILSSRPKTAIVKEILRSLAKLISANEPGVSLGEQIRKVIGKS
ncbi:MAG: hypothetical protein ACR2PB_14870 [Desulfocapsaceae bacterium]